MAIDTGFYQFKEFFQREISYLDLSEKNLPGEIAQIFRFFQNFDYPSNGMECIGRAVGARRALLGIFSKRYLTIPLQFEENYALESHLSLFAFLSHFASKISSIPPEEVFGFYKLLSAIRFDSTSGMIVSHFFGSVVLTPQTIQKLASVLQNKTCLHFESRNGILSYLLLCSGIQVTSADYSPNEGRYKPFEMATETTWIDESVASYLERAPHEALLIDAAFAPDLIEKFQGNRLILKNVLPGSLPVLQYWVCEKVFFTSTWSKKNLSFAVYGRMFR